MLSFQENGTDVFGAVRDRLKGGKGRLRQNGSDYLMYALIDAVVDQYFTVLEMLGERIESLQERVIADPKPDTTRHPCAETATALCASGCVAATGSDEQSLAFGMPVPA